MGCIYKPKYNDRKGNRHEGKTWAIKWYQNGKAVVESAKTTDYAEAKRLLKQREGDVAAGKPLLPGSNSIKFNALTEDEVNDYKVNNRRSLRDLEARLRLHILPAFGERKASAVDTAAIRAYTTQRLQESASNGTVNRELTIIRRAFSLGLQTNRVMRAPHVPMLKENNARQGFFEAAQFDVVERLLPEHAKRLARFGYITGWRSSEIKGLQWRNIEFVARSVRLEPGTTKNDEGRTFPFTLELESLLLGQRASADDLKKRGIITPWVFHFAGDGRPITEFKRSWHTACRRAGVPGKIFHDLRRTAVRNLVRCGVPERVAMMMTGHKTRSVFERYNIVSEGDLFDAARKMDEAAVKARSERHPSAEAVVVADIDRSRQGRGFQQCAPVAQVDRASVS